MGRKNGNRRTAGHYCLQLSPSSNSAAIFIGVNKFFDGKTQFNFVPLLFPTPILAYSDPPILMMCGTAAMLSTLFTTVGHPHKPETAGNGGLILGLPRFPSNDSIKAVSSPQI